MLATLAWILTAVAAWCGLSIATVAAWVAAGLLVEEDAVAPKKPADKDSKAKP